MKSESDPPERLREAGATDLERRLLGAASRERPSPELSARMAAGIGLSLPPVVSGDPAVSGPETSAPHVATASSALVPWVTGAVVAAVVAGLFVASGSEPEPARAPAPATRGSSVTAPIVEPPAIASASDVPGAVAPAPNPQPTTTSPTTPGPSRARSNAAENDLGEQIALMDSARSALARGSAERALALVRDYQARYSSGAFRPEAAAIRVEALVKLGRAAEARGAAERFIAGYGPGPLAERVARLAGLAEP